MRSTLFRAGAAVLAWCWLGVAAAQAPAAADADLAKQQAQRQQTQPLNNAPVWKEVRSGQPQITSLPGRETNVLIQPEGQTWRAQRVPIATAGGLLISVVLLALVGFYAWRGPIEMKQPQTGRVIERFSPAKRIVHWSVAITFVVLGVTGLMLTFGKSVLLPIIGYTLFSWLAILGKNLHNFVGPIFSLLLPVMIVMFVADNLPARGDAKWLAKLGGLLDRSGKTHVPAGKVNAGQKVLFWIMVVVLSIVLVVSGYVLNFPNFDQTRQTMQFFNLVHLIASMLALAIVLFHIYLGTIGMRGAYDAMRYGYVDETWAKEHHEYWYNDVMAGRAPRGAPPPAPAPANLQHKPA